MSSKIIILCVTIIASVTLASLLGMMYLDSANVHATCVIESPYEHASVHINETNEVPPTTHFVEAFGSRLSTTKSVYVSGEQVCIVLTNISNSIKTYPTNMYGLEIHGYDNYSCCLAGFVVSTLHPAESFVFRIELKPGLYFVGSDFHSFSREDGFVDISKPALILPVLVVHK